MWLVPSPSRNSLTTEAGGHFYDPLAFKSMRYVIRWHTFQSNV